MPHLDFSDEQLVRNLVLDGEAALRELYNRYAKRLYLSALYKTSSKEAAEEIVQEIFVSIWEKRGQLRIEHVESYLYTALKYQVIDHLRKQIAQKRVQALDEAAVLELPAQGAVGMGADELRGALEQSILQLPLKTRQIFVMSRFEELSHREIASRLDVSEKTVEYHIGQALKHLRSTLREYLICWILLPIWI